jgi:hypothetical protein
MMAGTTRIHSQNTSIPSIIHQVAGTNVPAFDNRLVPSCRIPGKDRLRGGGQAQSRPAASPDAQAAANDVEAQAEISGIAFAQPGDVVAVTGASGYVAGHVIRALIDKG